MKNFSNVESPPLSVHPWLQFQSLAELEGWMELNNQELQKLIGNKSASGQGICLSLQHGGEIFIHTNSDGDVLVDVTPDAAWVAPVISACTQVMAPRGQIWLLPQHSLLPLMMGLNTLIATSQLVLKHTFNLQKRYVY